VSSEPSQPSEEELRAAYEAEIKRLRVEHILLDNVAALANLGMRRTGLAPGTESERDPAQVRLAIESIRALLPVVEQAAPAQVGAIRDALSQLQMAFVRIGGAGEAGPADPGADGPPAGGASGPGPSAERDSPPPPDPGAQPPPEPAAQPPPDPGAQPPPEPAAPPPPDPGAQPPPEPAAPAPPAPGKPGEPGPAQRSGRLWVPRQ
jgi:hypothetical protein